MAEQTAAIYQTEQIRLLEQRSNVSSEILMERAGMAVFHTLRQHWPKAKRVLILCGPGNNGGDGYVVSRLAQQAGLAVTVWTISEQQRYAGAAQQALQQCLAVGIQPVPYQENLTITADVIVDALFGIGIRKPITGLAASLMRAVNASDIPVLAVDVPSGLCADTGRCLGSAINASLTLTFIGVKLGLVTGQGPQCAGQISVCDLDLPASIVNTAQPCAAKIQIKRQDFLPRLRDAHKGNFGHVLIVGGDHGMGGAVILAAKAALRSGAGLVTVATRAEHLASVLSVCPEVMCHALEKPRELLPLLAKASVVVIGPGLGRGVWGKRLRKFVLASRLPLVVDADALYQLPKLKRNNWVLTPHPGEAAQLLSKTSEVIQADRLTAVNTLQQNFGGINVLKGAGTLVAFDNKVHVCCAGNPGMASAGMGDVLSGVIGAFIAQGMTLSRAASLGVQIHAMAGDQAASRGERGLCASDVIAQLQAFINTPR